MYVNILLDTNDSFHLTWRTKWRTRISIFSCTGLWDDMDDQSQQSSR